jgi:hypothetical protein
VIPVRIKHSGGRKWMIPAAGPADGGAAAPKHEAPILTALSRAFHRQRLLDEGRVASGSEIARRERLPDDRQRTAAADPAVADRGEGAAGRQAVAHAQPDLAEAPRGAGVL